VKRGRSFCTFSSLGNWFMYNYTKIRNPNKRTEWVVIMCVQRCGDCAQGSPFGLKGRGDVVGYTDRVGCFK
jgi:hypothetical protein